jgi:hypothetical protein
MKTKCNKRIVRSCILLGFLLTANVLNAQLNKTFEEVFNKILGDNGALTPVPVIVGGVEIANHRDHFQPAADQANQVLVPALNTLIASNLSSFPLSSTSVGFSYDFTTGQPVSIMESLGPILAETGRTLGQWKVNIGINYSYMDLARFRGLSTEEIRFTFPHQDVQEAGLGETNTESDVMDIFLDLNAAANIFAFYATLGLTNNMDVGIALPVLNVNLSGDARAVIHSFTHAHLGEANHHFGPEGSETNEPVLEHTEPYSENDFGIGDLAVRFKYGFLQGAEVNLAALLDVRLPTGREEDFLGTGETNVRLSAIASRKFGDFTPHLNVGYDYRKAEFDSDEVEFAAGFDHKIARGLTFALDLLGEIDLNKDEILTFEYEGDDIIIVDRVETSEGEEGTLTRVIDQTNIPNRNNDSIVNAAFGLKYAPNENLLLIGNALVPLNDGGLRPAVAFTFGLAVLLAGQ